MSLSFPICKMGTLVSCSIQLRVLWGSGDVRHHPVLPCPLPQAGLCLPCHLLSASLCGSASPPPGGHSIWFCRLLVYGVGKHWRWGRGSEGLVPFPPPSWASGDKGSLGLRVHSCSSHQSAEYFIVGRRQEEGHSRS